MKPWYFGNGFKHITLWLIWFGLNSVIIFGSTVPLDGAFWLQVAINFSSLVAAYYSAFLLIRSLCKHIDYEKYDALGFWGRIVYIMRAELIVVIVLVVVYVTFTVWLDNTAGYNYPNLLAHIDQRFGRVAPYVILAGVNAHYAMYRKGQKQIALAIKERHDWLEKELERIKELYRELSRAEIRN